MITLSLGIQVSDFNVLCVRYVDTLIRDPVLRIYPKKIVLRNMRSENIVEIAKGTGAYTV